MPKPHPLINELSSKCSFRLKAASYNAINCQLWPLHSSRKHSAASLQLVQPREISYKLLSILLVQENVEHCGGEPEQAADMHMNIHAEMNSSVYECRLCTTLTWSHLNPPCIILYGLWASCRWWSVCSCCDKQEIRCRASLNLSVSATVANAALWQ